MDFNSRQILALALVVVLIANMVLLGLGKVSEIVFWGVLACVAVFMFALKKKRNASG